MDCLINELLNFLPRNVNVYKTNDIMAKLAVNDYSLKYLLT